MFYSAKNLWLNQLALFLISNFKKNAIYEKLRNPPENWKNLKKKLRLFKQLVLKRMTKTTLHFHSSLSFMFLKELVLIPYI